MATLTCSMRSSCLNSKVTHIRLALALMWWQCLLLLFTLNAGTTALEIRGTLNALNNDDNSIDQPYYIIGAQGSTLYPVQIKQESFAKQLLGKLCTFSVNNHQLTKVVDCNKRRMLSSFVSSKSGIGLTSYPYPSIRGLVMIANQICEYKATISKTDVLRVFNPIINEYFRNCSFGSLGVDLQIVDGIVLPCNGMGVWNYTFDSHKCGAYEIYTWMSLAQNQAQSRSINVLSYPHQILVIPELSQCPWAGLGSVSCASQCNVWIKSGSMGSIVALAHELGHNLGLNHASSPTDSYGDYSCVMGGCCPTRCFNVFQQARMNWNKPLTTLYVANNSYSDWITYDIPSAITKTVNYIQIVLNYTHVFTISYRTRLGYDNGLSETYSGALSFHIFSSDSQEVAATRAFVIGTLSNPGGIWNHRDSGVQVRLNNKDIQKASVSIKLVSSATFCGNGVCDNNETYLSCPQDCKKNNDNNNVICFCSTTS